MCISGRPSAFAGSSVAASASLARTKCCSFAREVPAGNVSATAVTEIKGVNKDEMIKAVECFLKSMFFCSPSLSLKQSNKINNATVDEF